MTKQTTKSASTLVPHRAKDGQRSPVKPYLRTGLVLFRETAMAKRCTDMATRPPKQRLLSRGRVDVERLGVPPFTHRSAGYDDVLGRQEAVIQAAKQLAALVLPPRAQ